RLAAGERPTFHSRTLLSAAAASSESLGENASPSTAAVIRSGAPGTPLLSVNIHAPVLAPKATLSARRTATARADKPTGTPLARVIGWPTSRSTNGQRRTVLSLLPVMSPRPSGRKANPLTTRVCPRGGKCSVQPSAVWSHRRTVPSPPVE